MDYVLRVRLTDDIKKILENNNFGKKQLEPITSYYYKPKGVKLRHFTPRMNVVRLRKFPDRETITKAKIFKLGLGYTDEKQKIDNLEGYDKWGELKSRCTEYNIMISGTMVKMLKEDFPFGKFVKIESQSRDILSEAVSFLGAQASETINKTAVELLAEHMKLI